MCIRDRIGTTAVSAEFGHLGFKYDTTRLDKTIRHLNGAIHLALENSYANHPKNDLEMMVDWSNRLSDRLLLLKEAVASRPDAAATRNRRFICGGLCVAAIASIAAVISVSVGIYTVEETRRLSYAISETNEALDSEVLRLEEFLSSSADLDGLVSSALNISGSTSWRSAKLFWLSSALNQAARQIEHLERAANAAAQNRLDISTLTSSFNASLALDDLASKASKKGLFPVSTDLHDLLHLPAAITYTTSGFEIFVHVPLIQSNSIMKVYQHIHLPLPIFEGNSDIFMQLSSDTDTIALSQDKKRFRVTSAMELNNDCVRVGNFFACPRGNTARVAPSSKTPAKDDPGLCMWGLLTSDMGVIHATCHKSFVKPGPAVVQLTPRTFITYGATAGNITCRSSKFSTTFRTTSYGSFHLPPGCSALSPHFALHSSDSAFTRSELMWAQASMLPSNMTLLAEDVNANEIKALMDQADDIEGRITHISCLLYTSPSPRDS